MAKCTAAQAVKAFEYWDGYYEKATSAYSNTRDKSAFTLNKGANNYTYAGYICGINGPGGPWCAMQVSLSIYEACGNDKTTAKEVMWGVWPYTACNQLYDAAPAASKGKRGAWTPKAGDVIVFSDNGSTRTHTGMVYSVDKTYVYTIEGNSSNMCTKRSYPLTSTYIWGYVRPNYAASADQPDQPPEPVEPANKYGKVVFTDLGLHELSNGCVGPEVKTIQRIIYARGINKETVDGEFGPKTKAGVQALQKQLGLAQTGTVDKDTWKKALTELD